MNTIGHEPGPVDIHMYEGASLYEQPGEIVFRANGVFNQYLAATAGFDVDPGIAKTEDGAVLDVERLAARKLDAVACGWSPDSVDAKISKYHHVLRPSRHQNPVTGSNDR